MKQLKQSPVAKIIAWILITVSALMLLAGTAGAYIISELGFYTKSVQEIREEQFERIAGKYSARVLQNLNNTENETYFKDTNFRYGVVEASNYEELEKLDLNQQSTYVQSNFDEKVSLDNLHLFQCNMNADTSIYVDNSVLGGYYITHSTREYRNKYINEYVYDTDSGIFYYQVSDVSAAQISEEGETEAEIWYFPVSEVKVTLVDDSTGETTDYAYVYNTADKEYEALQQGMSEGDGQAVLCITIQNATGADENDLRNVKNILENAPLTFWKLTATTYSYGTSDWTAEMRYPYTQEQQTEQVTVSETVVSAPTTVTSPTVSLSVLTTKFVSFPSTSTTITVILTLPSPNTISCASVVSILSVSATASVSTIVSVLTIAVSVFFWASAVPSALLPHPATVNAIASIMQRSIDLIFLPVNFILVFSLFSF
jgi:hypothetical protein